MAPVAHPGRLLKRELAARQLSASRLALDLGVPSGRITDILNGRRSITADTAVRLGRYFGNSAKVWLDLQGPTSPRSSAIAAPRSRGACGLPMRPDTYIMRATVFAYPATLSCDSERRFLVRFPDLPEALTDGASEAEALREAADALSEALMSRIVDGESIPDPSPIRRNQYQIAPEPTVALKAALHKAMRERKATAADLSRMLEIDHKEARRLLD